MTVQLSIQSATDFIHQATGNFDGAHPSGAMSTSQRGFSWASDTSQGLIDPLRLGIVDPLRVVGVKLYMSGQSTWEVRLIDGSDVAVMASGTTEPHYSGTDIATLAHGQKLQVVTTGAGTASIKLVCTLANPNFYIVPVVDKVGLAHDTSVGITGCIGREENERLAVNNAPGCQIRLEAGKLYLVRASIPCFLRVDAQADIVGGSVPLDANVQYGPWPFATRGTAAPVVFCITAAGAGVVDFSPVSEG